MGENIFDFLITIFLRILESGVFAHNAWLNHCELLFSKVHFKIRTNRTTGGGNCYLDRFTPKFYFILGIIFNLSLLCFFKYTDFLLENFNLFSQIAHLDFNIPLPHILLPLALSFVTFQQIAFLFDCYKHTTGQSSENLNSKNIDFIDYALFISFFPQLIAGPIVHHREMMPQFAKMGANSNDSNISSLRDSAIAESKQSKSHESKSQNKSITQNQINTDSLQVSDSPKAQRLHSGLLRLANARTRNDAINYEFLAKGIFIFSIGLFKKVFIADSFAKWANAGFGIVENGGVLNIAESWATSLSYTFQLYFDFSGYCDMAMGLALMFGIVLPLNFNSPYKSLNIAEFWRRWHITLGRFLKECLYIPLGGNKMGKILNLRNLFIVAFLSGIWHGAGWGFVVWGVLHGVAMVINRIYAWFMDSLQNKTCHTERSEVSKPHESNQNKESMPQKRINKLDSTLSHCDSYNLDSRVLDCFGKSNDSPRNDDKNNIKSKLAHFTQSKIYKILAWFITFNFVNIAWVFFRAENLQGALNLLKGMFGIGTKEMPHKWSKICENLNAHLATAGQNSVGTNEIIIWILCAFIVCLACKNSFEMLKNFDTKILKISISARIYGKKIWLKGGAVFTRFALTLALFYVSIWILLKNVLDSNAYTPFLYFNF